MAGSATGHIPNFALDPFNPTKQDIYQNYLKGKIVQPPEVQSQVSEATVQRQKQLADERAKILERDLKLYERQQQLVRAKSGLTDVEIKQSEDALGAVQKIYEQARSKGKNLGIQRPQTVLPTAYYANQAIKPYGDSFLTGPKVNKDQLAALNRAYQVRTAKIGGAAGDMGNITPNEGPTISERKFRNLVSSNSGASTASEILSALESKERFQKH